MRTRQSPGIGLCLGSVLYGGLWAAPMMLALPLLPFFALPFAMWMARKGPFCGALAMLTALIGMSVFMGPVYALVVGLIAFAPAATAWALLQRPSTSPRDGVLGTAGVMLLCIVAVLGVFYLSLGGGDLVDHLMVWTRQFLLSDNAGALEPMTRTVVLANRMVETMLSDPEALEGLAASVQALDPAALADAFVSFLGAQLRLILPSVLILGSFLGGGLTYYFTLLLQRRKGAVVPRFPRVPEWRMPRGMGAGLVVMALLGFFGDLFGWTGFDTVAYTTQALFSTAFGIQGMATMVWFLKRKKVPGPLQVLLCILGWTAPMLPTLMTLLGVVDETIQLRRVVEYRAKMKF